MKRSAIALSAIITMLLAGASLAGPPLPGAYDSTDMGGPVDVGRYTEGWDPAGSAMQAGTTLQAESWDGAALGMQWRYWCATLASDGVLLTDNVDGNGNGNRTYMKIFIGGFIWLSGTGPWANGDADYPGTIDSYVEFETITYDNWVEIAAITNVQASAHFDNYPDECVTFYIGNGSLAASTDLGDPVPPDYPSLMDTACGDTRVDGAFWDFFTITLSITGCTTPTRDTTWGAVKAMYNE